MQQVPFINDHWQFRLNRKAESSEDQSIKSLCNDFWRAQRQDERRLLVGDLELELHTFEKGLRHSDACIDLTIAPQPYMHKFRLLAGHAALRAAIATTHHRKVISVLPGNIRDLSRDQLGSMCERLVQWLDSVDRLYMSPFSPSADIFRNWLKGVYTGGTPAGDRPSLFALERILADRRSLIIETANALVAAVISLGLLDSSAAISVHGAGLYAESVAVTLGINGYKARQIIGGKLDTEAELLLLVDSGLKISRETDTSLTDKIIFELGPDQIDPSADRALKDCNAIVINDLICGCSEDMVEKWLLAGSAVDSWQHYIQLEYKDLLDKYLNLIRDQKLNHADAALTLALDNLKTTLF